MTQDKCFNYMKSVEWSREEKDWEIYNFDIDDFMCSRCGRWNHLVHECYATRDVYAIRLIDNGKRRPNNRTTMVISKGINKKQINKTK